MPEIDGETFTKTLREVLEPEVKELLKLCPEIRRMTVEELRQWLKDKLAEAGR